MGWGPSDGMVILGGFLEETAAVTPGQEEAARKGTVRGTQDSPRSSPKAEIQVEVCLWR